MLLYDLVSIVRVDHRTSRVTISHKAAHSPGGLGLYYSEVQPVPVKERNCRLIMTGAKM
ncbi:hypothetical protein ACKFKF_13910 [Phormidesmis sp. 146-12]